jgi:hypothetical protein
MSKTRQNPTGAATTAFVLAGAVLAAALGMRAGAALRPDPAEQGPAAAPQQIVLNATELASAERAGGGWPARALATLRGA